MDFPDLRFSSGLPDGLEAIGFNGLPDRRKTLWSGSLADQPPDERTLVIIGAGGPIAAAHQWLLKTGSQHREIRSRPLRRRTWAGISRQ
jgi:hypothetical protein